MIEAKVIADSFHLNPLNRITTLQLKYHRFIHAEFMTHRVFSRSASSSRAIPINKIIAQVWNDPAMPSHWGSNISGMQAKTELTGIKLWAAKTIWKISSKFACIFAYLFSKIGLHKQISNRILEPWQYINVILTATEFENFLHLRIHPDAQPEIQQLATKIKEAIDNSIPKELQVGEWHLPYITQEEFDIYDYDILLKCSTARCARVSYSNHDGSKPNVDRDVDLHDKLVGSEPRHSSPAEHQATPGEGGFFYKNLKGWVQYRSELEDDLLTKQIEKLFN